VNKTINIPSRDSASKFGKKWLSKYCGHITGSRSPDGSLGKAWRKFNKKFACPKYAQWSTQPYGLNNQLELTETIDKGNPIATRKFRIKTFLLAGLVTIWGTFNNSNFFVFSFHGVIDQSLRVGQSRFKLPETRITFI
jgi:hypothetical protein